MMYDELTYLKYLIPYMKLFRFSVMIAEIFDFQGAIPDIPNNIISYIIIFVKFLDTNSRGR